MISLLLMLALSGSCERREGSAQCVETHYNTVDHLWRGVGSCYTKDNKDGGYTPRRIKCVADSDQACRDDLDRQARNGCQP
jgi:hypothetical protein